jgi:hypothetical protein
MIRNAAAVIIFDVLYSLKDIVKWTTQDNSEMAPKLYRNFLVVIEAPFNPVSFIELLRT